MSTHSMGITDAGTLTACPDKPNCRCSDVSGDDHSIAPLVLKGDAQAAWSVLKNYVEAQPRFKVISNDDHYLHVEARTKLLRFTDDVEFHLRPDDGQIAMRSASRVGYSDLGANKKRLEAVRAAMIEAGVVSASP
ncbi:MAG: DUF1499 domain-containing protein [Gammaproteobacteria bacterium]